MLRFEFKLQPVLDQRQRIEDECQRDLAQVLRQRMIFQQQLRSLQQSITDDKNTMAESLTGTVDVPRIRQHAKHASHITQRAQQLAVSLLGLERRIDTSREKLLDATKARKAIGLLREKQHARWMLDEKRREAATLDELATQTHVRKMRDRVA